MVSDVKQINTPHKGLDTQSVEDTCCEVIDF